MGRRRFQFTSRFGLALTGAIGVLAAGAWWWEINRVLTPNRVVALVFTGLLTVGPPVLASFLIPYSPGGQLLAKIRARTLGQWVAGGCALFLAGHTVRMLRIWWDAQPATAEANLVLQQTILGTIGFILIPALCITAATWSETAEEMKQAHLVKRYEVQVQGDVKILRGVLLRAQSLSMKGWSRLSPLERQELAAVQRGLVVGLDDTLHEISASVQAVSGATLPFLGLFDHEDSEELENDLRYLERAIRGREAAGDDADQVLGELLAGQPRLLERHRGA